MGFVRCGVFHVPMIPKILKNVGVFPSQSSTIVGESTQALVYHSGKIRGLVLHFKKGVEQSEGANEGSGGKRHHLTQPYLQSRTQPSYGKDPAERTTSIDVR